MAYTKVDNTSIANSSLTDGVTLDLSMDGTGAPRVMASIGDGSDLDSFTVIAKVDSFTTESDEWAGVGVIIKDTVGNHLFAGFHSRGGAAIYAYALGLTWDSNTSSGWHSDYDTLTNTIPSWLKVTLNASTGSYEIYSGTDGIAWDLDESGTWTTIITILADLEDIGLGLHTLANIESDDRFAVEFSNITFDRTIIQVDTPVITPSSGDYEVNQLITITCDTIGASIYYTDDGSTPTSGDTLYSSPFMLTSAKTIKTIGIKAGDSDSVVAIATYTITVVDTGPNRIWGVEVGAGSWDFTEQPNKWGYLNNPRWTTSPEPGNEHNYTGREDEEPQVWNIDGNYSSEEGQQHIPCGHWHKGRTPSVGNANIYTIWTASSGAESITAVYFNGSNLTLTLIGTYISPDTDELKGLDFYGENLITTSGSGATTDLRVIDSTVVGGLLALINTYNPFDTYDVTKQETANIVHGDGENYYYVEMVSGRVIKLDNSLTKVSWGIHGTVTTGTDGNLYYNNGGSGLGSAWADFPITEPNWNIWWTLLEDPATDSPITVRYDGDAFQVAADIGFRNVLYYNNKLYICYYASVGAAVREIDLSDYSVTNNYSDVLTSKIVITPGLIHFIQWTLSNVYIKSLNLSDFSPTGNYITRHTLSDGSVCAGDSWVLFCAKNDLIKFNPKVYVEEIINSLGYTYTDLVTINDNYAVGTYGSTMDLIDVHTLEVLYTLGVGIDYSRIVPKETVVKII